MKARIHWQCQPRTKKADYEAEEIYIDVDLPFVPPMGSQLMVHKDGEFGTVENIFVELHEGGCPLRIYLEDPELRQLRPWKEMQAQGWQAEPN